MRTKNTYAEQLLDPRWQKKRLEVLNNAEFSCQYCGDGKSTLHVHHKQYIKGRQVWEYENSQLISLCKNCHTDQHENEEKFNDLIARIPLDGPSNKDEVYFLIAGFIGHEVSINHPNEQTIYDLGAVCADWWVKK